MSILEREAISTIEKYKMIQGKDRILVGVSGGPDSVALLYFLNSLKKKYNFEIFAAYLNHSLRKEAEREEKFVKDFCEKLGIKVYIGKKDVIKYKNNNKLSLEEAAREIRYLFFKEIMKKIDANKLALAHNADDRIETSLMFLIRGCGREGVKGIPPVRKEENFIIIRPFIKIFRNEIEKYLNEKKLNYCIDYSNFEKKFFRNKIRHNLIPYLKRYNPQIKEEILKFSEIEEEENQFLEEITIKNYRNILVEKRESLIVLDRKKFENLHISLKRRILRFSIKEIKKSLNNVGFDHIESMIEYIKGGNNIKLSLPDGIFLKVEENRIFISDKKFKYKKNYSYEFNIPGILYIKEVDMKISARIIEEKNICFENKNFAYFDYEKIGKNILLVRNRREKDKFSPYGMGKVVRLKKFLINQKIPLPERDLLPLVLKDGEIIWVAGVRNSDKFLVDENTKKILELKLIR